MPEHHEAAKVAQEHHEAPKHGAAPAKAEAHHNKTPAPAAALHHEKVDCAKCTGKDCHDCKK